MTNQATAIKIVFSDMDGTLLNAQGNVLPRTAVAVRQLLGHDIPFVIVSGRSPGGIYPITQSLGIAIPIICYSGALALGRQGETIASFPIPNAEAKKALQAIRAGFPEATACLYTDAHWYVESKDARVLKEETLTKGKSEVADFTALLSAGTEPHKFMLIGEPPLIERAEKELGAALPQLHVVRSSPILLEINEQGISKVNGIEAMLMHYGLTAKEALSFGDNYNDLEMLKYTGQSVAMANAPEDVKRVAKAVTSSNEEDGIAAYLEKTGLI